MMMKMIMMINYLIVALTTKRNFNKSYTQNVIAMSEKQ